MRIISGKVLYVADRGTRSVIAFRLIEDTQTGWSPRVQLIMLDGVTLHLAA